MRRRFDSGSGVTVSQRIARQRHDLGQDDVRQACAGASTRVQSADASRINGEDLGAVPLHVVVLPGRLRPSSKRYIVRRDASTICVFSAAGAAGQEVVTMRGPCCLIASGRGRIRGQPCAGRIPGHLWPVVLSLASRRDPGDERVSAILGCSAMASCTSCRGCPRHARYLPGVVVGGDTSRRALAIHNMFHGPIEQQTRR